jgi:hypothetical protein
MSILNDSKALEEHPLMKRYINYYKKSKDVRLCYKMAFQNLLCSIVIAPFQTISISRQLSVTPHKNLYGDYVDPKKSTELTKISSEVTLRESRNYELIKTSGVIEGQKPYRAPIYDNYIQTIKGLYRQGILGFYKGNFWRIWTFSISQRGKITLEWFLRERYDFFSNSHFLRDWICLTIADFATHFGFVTENRYILQNRLPQFQIYKNFFKLQLRNYHEITRGITGHIPKNFFYLIGFYIYYNMPSTGNYMIAVLCGNILSYPIMTGFRRIVCESSSTPGLLPLRYLNLLHAVFLIRREEGLFRGLYKGFFMHVLATLLWIGLVPTGAYYNFYKEKTEEDQEFFVNDPIFEEIKKRKIANLKT